MKSIRPCLIGTVILLNVTSCGDVSSIEKQLAGFEALSGPYLGQEPPGDEPEIFLPGLITSTKDYERSTVFLDDGKLCVFAQDEIGINFTREEKGHWTRPERLPLEYEYLEFDYTARPDGQALVFQTQRPTSPDDTELEGNIWTMEWTGDGWTEPRPLPEPPNTGNAHEGYPVLTSDGTAYFFSGGPNDSLPVDLYRSQCVDGVYQEPEKLETPINSDYDEHDPYVAPDESYLMFGSRRPGGLGRDDTYICFRREDGTWTHPLNLGNKLNSVSGDNRINVTPDGSYFFFNSGRDSDISNEETAGDPWATPSAVYWVDTSFIDALKQELLHKDCAAEVIAKAYREKGLQSAVRTLAELHAARRDDFYFSYYELLMICEQMIRAGRDEDADRFFEALVDTLPDDNRIRRGYAMVCTMNGRTRRGLSLLKETMSGNPREWMVDIYWRGFDLIRYGKLDRALEVMQSGVNELPESHLAYVGLAEVYEARGETEAAIESCRKALELKPDDEHAAALLKKLERP